MNDDELDENEYRVVVPSERFCVAEFKQDELPGIAVVNQALVEFEPKIVFAWHLSLMLHLDDCPASGLPSDDERKMIDDFGDLLDIDIKGENLDKPNALFLARITWNTTRELIYRANDPEPIHQYLSDLIEREFHPRPFDYRIDHDPEWKLAEWHLSVGTRDA